MTGHRYRRASSRIRSSNWSSGSISSETQTIRGRWHHEGVAYRDDLVRVFVDVPDEPEARQFFAEYKERLKGRFQQLDIWMTTYLVEVL
jgi:hypothetical protein